MLPFLDDVTQAADTLVAHGRLGDAIALVSALGESGQHPDTLVLLAHLLLQQGSQQSTEKAASILTHARCHDPEDFVCIALLREALRRLGRCVDRARLDREVQWRSSERTPRRLNRATA